MSLCFFLCVFCCSRLSQCSLWILSASVLRGLEVAVEVDWRGVAVGLNIDLRVYISSAQKQNPHSIAWVGVCGIKA